MGGVNNPLFLNAVQEVLAVGVNGQTAFTLSDDPSGDASFRLFLNGQLRQESVDYTRSGTSLTWLDPGGLTLLTTDELIAIYDDTSVSPGGGGGAVTSVFSRTGAVVAAASDYDASQVDNDSGVPGATVDLALDNAYTWSDDGTDVTPVNAGRNTDFGTGVLKDNDATTGVAFGQASTGTGLIGFTAISVLGALNELRAEVPVTKEAWFEATDYNVDDGQYRARSIGATGAHNFTFKIPSDFTTLTSIVLVGIPSAGAAGSGRDIDLISEYALVGEASNANTETDSGTTYDLTGTSGEITEVLDLSVVLSSLAANHFCGVEVDHNGIGGAIDYLGIRLRYT